MECMILSSITQSLNHSMAPVLIAAGGTGGHVFPAIQVARALASRGVEVLLVGSTRGLEARLAEQYGYRLEILELGGLNRVGMAQALATLAQLPRACWRASRILDDFKPDVAYGVGAYIS